MYTRPAWEVYNHAKTPIINLFLFERNVMSLIQIRRIRHITSNIVDPLPNNLGYGPISLSSPLGRDHLPSPSMVRSNQVLL
jgi:hypothetical protein